LFFVRNDFNSEALQALIVAASGQSRIDRK
jgi:hypothetical protein